MARSATCSSARSPRRSRAASIIEADWSTPIDAPGRQARDQRLGDAARAAAGVDDRLAAGQRQALEHLAAHRLHRAPTAGRSRRRSRSGPRSLLAAPDQAPEEAHDALPQHGEHEADAVHRLGGRGRPAAAPAGRPARRRRAPPPRRRRRLRRRPPPRRPRRRREAHGRRRPPRPGAGRFAPRGRRAGASGAGSEVIVACRHCEKSRIIRLEMSSIIPPRPKRASRPVIVKSVMTSTTVSSPSWRSVLTMTACAPPWPRLSVPLACIVAVRDASSSESIFSEPR